MTTETNRRALALAALTAAGCIWGTGYFFGKIAFAQLSVPHTVLYRFVFACLGFLPVVFRHPVRLRRADWGMLLIAAVLGIPIQFLIQFHGLALTTVSHASLMAGTAPVLLALGAFVVFRERMGWIGWLALGMSTIGVTLIVGNPVSTMTADSPLPSTARGDVLVLLSMLAGIAWILMSKQLMRRYSPPVVSAYVTLVGAVMLAGWILARDGAPPVTTLSAMTWLSLAIQGLLATTAATLLWNWGLLHLPAGHAGVFLNFEPVVGSLLGITILHESLGPWAIMGGVLIVGAAVAVTLSES